MTDTDTVKYPEHDKLRPIQAETQAVGEFIDWLESQGIQLAHYPDCILSGPHNGHDHECRKSIYLYGISKSSSTWIAEFFGIDEKKLEAEKRQMLKEIAS